MSKTGRALMQQVWSWNSKILRATAGPNASDENFHEGLKLLSEDVMAGVRNAHEPILDWPIQKDDCIAIQHLLSLLYRKLDNAVNIQSFSNNP